MHVRYIFEQNKGIVRIKHKINHIVLQNINTDHCGAAPHNPPVSGIDSQSEKINYIDLLVNVNKTKCVVVLSLISQCQKVRPELS